MKSNNFFFAKNYFVGKLVIKNYVILNLVCKVNERHKNFILNLNNNKKSLKIKNKLIKIIVLQSV